MGLYKEKKNRSGNQHKLPINFAVERGSEKTNVCFIIMHIEAVTFFKQTARIKKKKNTSYIEFLCVLIYSWKEEIMLMIVRISVNSHANKNRLNTT